MHPVWVHAWDRVLTLDPANIHNHCLCLQVTPRSTRKSVKKAEPVEEPVASSEEEAPAPKSTRKSAAAAKTTKSAAKSTRKAAPAEDEDAPASPRATSRGRGRPPRV